MIATWTHRIMWVSTASVIGRVKIGIDCSSGPAYAWASLKCQRDQGSYTTSAIVISHLGPVVAGH
jgi:hypothetical protein